VLKNYLDAWLPILGTWNGRILFIDGFAGPGEYEDGEPGSPLIALDGYLKHAAQKKIRAEVVFFFVEGHKKRFEHLKQLVESRRAELPEKCKVNVVHGNFDEHMAGLFDYLETQQKQMAPAFVMVDPFGVKGTPMSAIEGVLKNRRCEVYVSFMYEAINRWKNSHEFEPHLDALFGCEDWREGRKIEDSTERKTFFYYLFDRQLRAAGAKQVVRFELYNGNRLVYAIFFATKGITGADRMKNAIWKAVPEGNFEFRGGKDSQLSLGLESPDFEPLKAALLEHFSGERFVSITAVLDFVSSDATDYHRHQVKKNALVPLEKDGLLEADEATRKKKRTYPDRTKIRFLEGKEA
jgi:three-Cys-motif partner protein